MSIDASFRAPGADCRDGPPTGNNPDHCVIRESTFKGFYKQFYIALPACTNPTFEATVAGGRLRKKHRDAMGIGMKAHSGVYKVDIGLNPVAGVDKDGTLLDFYQE